MHRILLIYPPWSRNSEPPLGLGLIQTFLNSRTFGKSADLASRILDLNAEAAWQMAYRVQEDGTTRTHRALLHRDEALQALASSSGYGQYDYYSRCMGFYADLLHAASWNQTWKLTPADFNDTRFNGFGPDTVDALLSEPETHPIIECCLDRLNESIREFRPTLTGISMTYRSQFIPGLLLAAIIRRIDPGIRICLGGAFIRNLHPDSRIRLEQQHIESTLENGESYFGRRIGRVSGPIRPRVFVSPDFTGVNRSQYFSPVAIEPRITSRGCYWGRCAFCDECREPFMTDSPGELTQYVSTGPDSNPLLHLSDHAIPPAVLTAFIKSGRHVPWYGFMRPERRLTEPGFVSQLAGSGCRMLQLGFETPVQSLLDRMAKGTQASDYPVIIENLKRFGIKCYAYMLFGYPGQTLADAEAAVHFLETSPPDFLNAALFRMPPGSPLFHRSQKGLPDMPGRHRDRLYIEFEDPGVSMRNWRRWMAERLNGSAVIRQMEQKTPHYYKSSHAVFF
ncbi:MAG TPA: hypothetical protein PLV45_02760 [bacterium]|nr:hypothetical protein [bacterium]